MFLSQLRLLITLGSIATLSGGALMFRTPSTPGTLSVWTFDAAPVDLWKQEAGGGNIDFEVMGPRALNVRLQSILAQRTPATAPPDVVAIEIGSAGRYLRGRAPAVPLLPLDAFLSTSPLRDRFLPSRAALWEHDGVTFGMPLDTHPVTLSYRRDLFAAAGVDLESPATWPQLRASLRRYAAQAEGQLAIELSRSNSDVVMQMLLQQHLDLFDRRGDVDWSDHRFARTIAFYATLVAGPQRIATEPASSPVLANRDLASGHVAACLTPDWRLRSLHRDATSLAGKLAMRPLPVFDPSDAPVSSWGGTMLAIPRTARNPAASWRLIEQTLLSDTTLDAWPRATGTLSAERVPSTAPLPPDALYAPQQPLELYARLAPLTPARHLTPFTTAALAQLSIVVGRAADYMDAHGEAGLEDFVRRELDVQSQDLRQRIAQFDLGSTR